uniref:Tetraspanin 31 n=1 Tax=Coturnix japonica TaxID=93934 RepID=A0A8C2T005_COTJA
MNLVCSSFSRSVSLVGLLLIAVAAWGRAVGVVSWVPLVGGVLAVGVLLLLIAAVGLVGAAHHHQVLLFFYMVVLGLLFLVQFSVSCSCLALDRGRQVGGDGGGTWWMGVLGGDQSGRWDMVGDIGGISARTAFLQHSDEALKLLGVGCSSASARWGRGYRVVGGWATYGRGGGTYDGGGYGAIGHGWADCRGDGGAMGTTGSGRGGGLMEDGEIWG